MLKTVESEGNASIISWMPGHPQDTFKVHNKEEFIDKVMPRFFNQTKFKSFLRQLNLWGFERILEPGPRRGGYRHSCFIKNQPSLCNQMKRTRIKGVKAADSGDWQQQQQQQVVVMAQHGIQSHPSTSSGHQRLATKTTGPHDDISFDTIEYEKIPDNIPIAADLSRMYAEDMQVLGATDETGKYTPPTSTVPTQKRPTWM